MKQRNKAVVDAVYSQYRASVVLFKYQKGQGYVGLEMLAKMHIFLYVQCPSYFSGFNPN